MEAIKLDVYRTTNYPIQLFITEPLRCFDIVSTELTTAFSTQCNKRVGLDLFIYAYLEFFTLCDLFNELLKTLFAHGISPVVAPITIRLSWW
jgi:hypothetical protein